MYEAVLIWEKFKCEKGFIPKIQVEKSCLHFIICLLHIWIGYYLFFHILAIIYFLFSYNNNKNLKDCCNMSYKKFLFFFLFLFLKQEW